MSPGSRSDGSNQGGTDGFLIRTEVYLERFIAAPPARVFAAWTTPELMSRWMWASLGNEVWAEADLRVGGAYRVYSHTPGGVHQGDGWSGMTGIYIEIVPDERLVYTQHWDADVGYNRPGRLALDEVIRVTFTGADGGTHLAFHQLGIPGDGSSAAGHAAGVGESLDHLAEILTA